MGCKLFEDDVNVRRSVTDCTWIVCKVVDRLYRAESSA